MKVNLDCQKDPKVSSENSGRGYTNYCSGRRSHEYELYAIVCGKQGLYKRELQKEKLLKEYNEDHLHSERCGYEEIPWQLFI